MKERLTGAIILVVLVVLLVPELLSGPKSPAATPSAVRAASASSGEPPLRSYTINLGDDLHSQSQTANGVVDSSGPPQPSDPAQPTPQPGSPQADAPDGDISESSTWDSTAEGGQQAQAHASPSASTGTATSPSSAAAQRATAGSRPEATTATAPLTKPSQAASAAASKSAASTAAGVPPKSTSAKTTRTAASEKPAKGHAAPATVAAGSEVGGWGVQLGVFASRGNAEKLALEVRVKGFKATVSPVSSGKRKLYRVRVGPAADRSAAQELQARLKAAGRPGGTVVPYS